MQHKPFLGMGTTPIQAFLAREYSTGDPSSYKLPRWTLWLRPHKVAQPLRCCYLLCLTYSSPELELGLLDTHSRTLAQRLRYKCSGDLILPKGSCPLTTYSQIDPPAVPYLLHSWLLAPCSCKKVLFLQAQNSKSHRCVGLCWGYVINWYRKEETVAASCLSVWECPCFGKYS